MPASPRLGPLQAPAFNGLLTFLRPDGAAMMPAGLAGMDRQTPKKVKNVVKG